MYPSGKRVTGRITNTAVNGAVTEIVFKDSEGNTHALAAGEQVIIYSIAANNRATAKDLTFFHDTDAGVDLDAAETLSVLSFGAAGFSQHYFDRGLMTKKITATTHKFYAFASAAGAVDITVEADIISAKS